MSPKKTGNTLSCLLLMYLLRKNPADAKYAPRAAARGTALRAVKALTSCQILPEPLMRLRISSHPKSIAGVPFDSVRRFRASLLLRTTCMHLCRNWVVSCVAA